MLARLGRVCYRRRGRTVVAWIAVLVLFGAGAGAAGSGFSTQFSPPDVESARGLDVLEEHFGGAGGGFGGLIVAKAADVRAPETKAALEEFFAKVAEIEGFTLSSPFSPQGGSQIASTGPLAGQLAYARVEVGQDITIEEAVVLTEQVKALEPDVAGLQIELGGDLFAEFAPPESEVLGLGFAIVILILMFGSVLAMGLPIGTAIAGIAVGTTIVTIVSNFMTMPEFTTVIGIMIGLGVGIDYALFIVTRYREGVHNGLASEDAAAVAIDTAGRAVLFAGVTVVISLMGMLLMGLPFVRGLAVGAATVVLVTMAASVTLLPALIGFTRHRLEVARWRGVIAAGLVATALIGVGLQLTALIAAIPLAVAVLVAGFFVPFLKSEVPKRPVKPAEETLAYRWSRVIQRRPWTAVIAGTLVLGILATPVLGIRLGFSDLGNYPEDTDTRRAYDLLAEGFGPGFNGPLVVVAEVDDDAAVVERVSTALGAAAGVAFATPAVPNRPESPSAALWQVFPTSAPQDEATDQLLSRLRSDVLPAAKGDADIDLLVTGGTAVSADFSSYMGDRMPLFIGVVLALSFLLLMAVFRSLLVPLKAVVMNLLSIGAAYGLVVAIFQWGWAKDLVGIGKGGPIEPFIPMMMFAIVFGLSMDYEVFLLSRIKEEYDKGVSNDRAVADGLAITAKVITAAAAIMVVVFGSFLLENDRIIKVFGLGLAAAVFLDATIVRMLLVPATMELLGDRNWWLPGWLGRILPKIDVEGHAEEGLAHHGEPAPRTDDEELTSV